MFIISALSNGANTGEAVALIQPIIKSPRKIFFRFEGGRFNAKGKVEEIIRKEIVCSNFIQFVADIIGCANFDLINVNGVVVSKHDGYFILVYKFKSSSDTYETIELGDDISLIAKFIVLEDVSEEKTVSDINALTGTVAGTTTETYVEPAPAIITQEPSYTPPQAVPPAQPSIHQQAAIGNGEVDKWDSALNDNSYTGGALV